MWYLNLIELLQATGYIEVIFDIKFYDELVKLIIILSCFSRNVYVL